MCCLGRTRFGLCWRRKGLSLVLLCSPLLKKKWEGGGSRVGGFGFGVSSFFSFSVFWVLPVSGYVCARRVCEKQRWV